LSKAKIKMAKRGRPCKYLTDSAKKKAKSFNNKCRLASQVNIGCCMEDWCSLKSEIGVLTDEEMARTLIDRYTILS
jgi:hypothetical protein